MMQRDLAEGIADSLVRAATELPEDGVHHWRCHAAAAAIREAVDGDYHSPEDWQELLEEILEEAAENCPEGREAVEAGYALGRRLVEK